MKKILAAAAVIYLIFAVVSCASSDAVSQEEVNEDFARVYAEYKSDLVLDGAQTYVTRRDDTLSSIAKSFYGSDRGYYFPIIMLASSDVILDPDLIAVGMSLTIPDLDANLSVPDIRANLKPFFTDIAEIYQEKNTFTAPKTRRELLKIAESL